MWAGPRRHLQKVRLLPPSPVTQSHIRQHSERISNTHTEHTHTGRQHNTETRRGGWTGLRGEKEVVNSTEKLVKGFIRLTFNRGLSQKSRKPDF